MATEKKLVNRDNDDGSFVLVSHGFTRLLTFCHESRKLSHMCVFIVRNDAY